MRSLRFCALVTGVAGATALAVVVAPGGAGAATEQLHVIRTVSSSYVGPLQFAVDGKRVFVADSFFSTLNRVGRSTPLATGPSSQDGGDLAGVAVDPATHDIAYTTSTGDHATTKLTILSHHAAPVVADLSGFEAKYNPDHAVQYGVVKPVSNCVKKSLKSMGVPVTYRGEVDSHPYAVTSIGHGNWAVADAGGNDILKVDSTGAVSVISVLPAQPVTITSGFAAANGLPSCAIGVVYRFEAVPTDVEVGPRGGLYATTLPGGPEGPDSGNPGSVYRIGATGSATRIATGFASATNLAISPSRDIYVAELGSGTISEVVHGEPHTVATLPGVVAVEWANGHLYASTAPAVFGGHDPGQILELG